MRFRFALALVPLTIACSPPKADRSAPPERAPAPVVEPVAAPPPVRYEVHEWGLIGTMATGGRALAVAGPWPRQPTPSELGHGFGDAPLGHIGTGASGGKPVLYVHLPEGGEVRFDMTLRTPGGRLVESWPAAEVPGDAAMAQLRGVVARREPCHGWHYPDPTDVRCHTSDSYCEALELATYETRDAACLEVDGHRYNHLFYRADVDRSKLPLEVTTQGSRVVVTHRGTAPIRGPLFLVVHRTGQGSTARVAVRMPPSPGESITIDRAATARDERGANVFVETLFTYFRELRLTSEEGAAFMRAWESDLVGAPGIGLGSPPPAGTPPPELAPAANAVFYLLPSETLYEIAPLEFTPPPTAVRRAMLVRVNLGE